jgi:predicted membrane-bound mannosyltransferase
MWQIILQMYDSGTFKSGPILNGPMFSHCAVALDPGKKELNLTL